MKDKTLKRKVYSMAQTVKIISDSTCDLSKDLLEKYDISILPLHILEIY